MRTREREKVLTILYYFCNGRRNGFFENFIEYMNSENMGLSHMMNKMSHMMNK